MLLSITKKLTVLIACAVLTSFTQNSCDLKVNVTGLRNANGHFLVSIWDNSTGFPDEGFLKELVYKDVKQEGFSFSINNLPYGDYALAALHDENKDGEMEYNWMGIPKEGYAFSRNYNVTIRAPKWEEAVMKLDVSSKEIEMKMQY